MLVAINFDIVPSPMPEILVVCTGNICRSPVVEALLRQALRQQGLDETWRVSSAGTWAPAGAPASLYSALLLAERGLDISQHRSRLVNQAMIDQADLILCLELGHAEALRSEFLQAADKIHLLAATAGPAYSVEDPYGGPREGYERMVAEVSNLVQRGLPRLIELAQSRPDFSPASSRPE